MEINTRLARKHGLQAWSNVETFERDMPIDFLPIAWPNLRYTNRMVKFPMNATHLQGFQNLEGVSAGNFSVRLVYKIEVAEAAGVEKLIMFEFSHFLSPNSMYPSAHTLYKRYREWNDLRG